MTDLSFLRQRLRLLGIVVATLATIAVPAIYAVSAYIQEIDALSFKSHLNAGRVSKYIYAHGSMWTFHRVRLIELIEINDHTTPLLQRIYSLSGRLVAQEGDELPAPTITRSTEILVNGEVVGRIEVSGSAQPLLINTALLALISSILALLFYFILNKLKLNLLDDALTKLDQREQQLAQQNMQFSDVLANMSQGLSRYDADLKLVIANKAYREFFGLTEDDIAPGTTIEQIYARHRIRGVDQPSASTENYGELSMDSESIARLENGRILHVLRKRMPDGGWLATHEDITEKQQLAQENDRNRKFLDAILDNVPAPIYVKDAVDRRYVLINRASEQFWGSPRESVLGKTSGEIFPKSQADFIDSRESQLLQSHDVLSDEREVLTPNNGTRHIIAKSLLLRDSDDKPKYFISVLEDITERKQSAELVIHMARHDALTGLANRVVFMEKLHEACARLRRSGEAFFVLMLDLDKFKNVNDTLGHPAGDVLLREVAQRLKSQLRETDVLARLGGDEFAIVMTAPDGKRDAAATVADKIIDAIAPPFDLDETKMSIGVSIGIAAGPGDGANSADLVKKADIALYRSKAGGRNQYCFFDAGMLDDLNARNQLEQDLRVAIEQETLELHYQPIIDAKTGLVCGVEALTRWNHPKLGNVPPDRFIPLAEQAGLIIPLGEWSLLRACTDAMEWPEHIQVAVNLSPLQFAAPDLMDVIICALVETGLPPHRLELEITETTLMANDSAPWMVLQQLKRLGVLVALDDFGTGYSSLSYLTKFPFDKVKIDRSYIHNMTKRASHAAIISSTLAIARDLDMTTTAEGVETKQQYEILRSAGVTSMQGYLFGKAVPKQQLDFAQVHGTATTSSGVANVA